MCCRKQRIHCPSHVLNLDLPKQELMSNETSYDTVFGKMALDQGLCTDEELHHSLHELESRRKVNPIMLKDLMIDLGFITWQVGLPTVAQMVFRSSVARVMVVIPSVAP